MATMVKTAQAELELQISAVVPEQEGLRTEVFRIMEASASAIERQIATAVEKARVELLAENDKLRSELQQAQLLLADTEEAAAIALERQVNTAVTRARADLTADNERLRSEVQRAKQLLSEYEQVAAERERAHQLLAETVESQRAALGEREKASSDFQAELRMERARLAQEWEVERERLSTECGELRHERNRFREELGRLADAAARSDIEKARLREECQKLEASSRTQKDAGSLVVEEAARVEVLLQDLIHLIEDPATDVSSIIRKNVERAQLDAYLRGLKFACAQR